MVRPDLGAPDRAVGTGSAESVSGVTGSDGVREVCGHKTPDSHWLAAHSTWAMAA